MATLRLNILFILSRICYCQGSLDPTIPACSFDALPLNDTFAAFPGKTITVTKAECYKRCLEDDTCTYLKFKNDLCSIFHTSSSNDMELRADSTDSVYKMTRNNSLAKPCQFVEFKLTRTPLPTTTTVLNDGIATTEDRNWTTKQRQLCFEVFNLNKTADEAEKYCESFGGRLASIHTQEENNFIHEKSNHTKTWIGLRLAASGEDKRDKQWIGHKHWIDHSPIDYENWNHDEPNNCGGWENCTVINEDSTWNDINCKNKFYFACQFEDEFCNWVDLFHNLFG